MRPLRSPVALGMASNDLQSVPELPHWLGHDLVWWREIMNTAMIWSLVLAALAAGAVVVTTWLGLVWDKRIKSHDDAVFERYKSGVDTRVAKAQLDGLDAGAKAADAQVKIKAQETLTAQANARAAEAQLATEKLREHLAWRELTPEQASKLSASASSRGAFQVRLTWPAGSPEAQALAQQIGKSLSAAGWSPDMGESSSMDFIPEGILTSPRDWEPVGDGRLKLAPATPAQLQAASTIEEVFKAAGIQAGIVLRPPTVGMSMRGQIPLSAPIIFVGIKPRSTEQ
jgi:hypothetical protein